MPRTPEGMRECPTRADGTDALFAHVISPATCQERQRTHYHKCPTCAFYNARLGVPPTPPSSRVLAGPAGLAQRNGSSGNGRVPAEAPASAQPRSTEAAAQKPA